MSPEAQAPDVAGTVFEEGAAEVAQSYAQAFLNLVNEGGDGEARLAELEEFVADVWEGQPEFASFLAGGFLQRERRDEVLGEILNGRADELLIRFLRVVNRRDRLALLPQIAREARVLSDRQSQVVEVSVRSAVELDEGQRAAVLGRLESMLPGRKPRLVATVDPSILGGLVLQVGDQLFDASVRTRLRQVHEQMISARQREIRAGRDRLAETS